MALHSETLEAHFESIRPLPPHQVMREQALKQAAQYGIPYEIAVAAIDAKLWQAAALYEAMIEARVEAEGEVGALRVEVDAALMAQEVLEAHGRMDDRLTEMWARHRKDLVDAIQGGNPENLVFAETEQTVV